MKIPFLAALLVCLPAVPAGTAEPARRVALVIDAEEPAERALFDLLARTYRSRAHLLPYVLSDAQTNDPIKKGKLLSEMETCDLVVAVGDGATEFTTRELDVPVFFVDASVVPGRRLSSVSISGVFAYSVEDVLDAVKALHLGAVGAAYTPGYEPVVEWIRAGAVARGLPFFERRIAAPREVSPGVRELLEKSRVIWLVGDPLLVRGAGFSYIQDSTLSMGLPLVGPGEWAVSRGALLGYSSSAEELAAAAERAIDALLVGHGRSGPRLRPAPRGGVVLLNATLSAKWKLQPSGGLRWRRVR